LLRELSSASAAEKDTLEAKQEQLANALWRAVVPELPKLLDAYSATRDLKGIATRLSCSTREALLKEVDTLLRDYDIDLSVLDTKVEIENDVAFEDGQADERIAVDYQRLHDALAKAIRKFVVRVADKAVGQCRSALLQLDKLTQGLEASLSTHEEELLVMKSNLRSEFD
jgi:hypothetical protein